MSFMHRISHWRLPHEYADQILPTSLLGECLYSVRGLISFLKFKSAFT
jgi:hypothetical protein